MKDLSYTISPNLKIDLQKLDELRKKILLSPIPPKIEIRLRFETMLNRVYWSMSLHNDRLTKQEVTKLIGNFGSRQKYEIAEQEVINYKKALDYISQNWLVSSKKVTVDTIEELYNIACRPTIRTNASIGSLEKSEIKHLLDYLQTGSDHPMVQAAIAQLQIADLSPFANGNGRVSRLLSLLFLYKYGYDVRGFLVLADSWRHDLSGFRYTTAAAIENKNFTPWLEYFAKGMLSQLEKALQTLNSLNFQIDLPATFWEINDRQKSILSYLEQPDIKITNKKVQNMFKISQITASRDLSRLATLGLVFARGKGRSVYYTKV